MSTLVDRDIQTDSAKSTAIVISHGSRIHGITHGYYTRTLNAINDAYVRRRVWLYWCSVDKRIDAKQNERELFIILYRRCKIPYKETIVVHCCPNSWSVHEIEIEALDSFNPFRRYVSCKQISFTSLWLWWAWAINVIQDKDIIENQNEDEELRENKFIASHISSRFISTLNFIYFIRMNQGFNASNVACRGYYKCIVYNLVRNGYE